MLKCSFAARKCWLWRGFRRVIMFSFSELEVVFYGVGITTASNSAPLPNKTTQSASLT